MPRRKNGSPKLTKIDITPDDKAAVDWHCKRTGQYKHEVVHEGLKAIKVIKDGRDE